MKKMLFALVALAGAISFADTPTVGNVRLMQRYPWNGLVDIDYEISGDTTGVSVSISVQDLQNGRNYTPTRFLSAPTVNAGKNRATWDTATEGVSIVSTNVVATVSLLSKGGSPALESPYIVIDLSGGTSADSYPVTRLSAVPDGGWTDEYKTTKLVLRRIEPGTFLLRGTVSATLSKPFFMGVFEVTQSQYALVTGSNPSWFNGSLRPVERVTFSGLRGSSKGEGWPGSSDVDDNSFFGKLRAKTGLETIDLPTEAQWEYACRAGTTSPFNNGGSTEDDLKQLGRYAGNKGDGLGGYSDHTVVGMYSPNAWGLYDMHGNVWEFCLDRIADEISGGTDPKGGASGSDRVMRGGGWDFGSEQCTSSYVGGHNQLHGGNNFSGFRVACTVGK